MSAPACDRDKLICPRGLHADAEIPRLQGVIADALAAMDEGRYGDARKILRTGVAKPLMAVTNILAKDRA